MPCLFDDKQSPDFDRRKQRLRKDFPKIDVDLAEAYAEIIENRKTACHANSVPGYANKVWKYRCGSSDMKAGRSHGFRILCYYSEAAGTLYPFCVFTHAEFPNQPPDKDIRTWVQNIESNLRRNQSA